MLSFRHELNVVLKSQQILKPPFAFKIDIIGVAHFENSVGVRSPFLTKRLILFSIFGLRAKGTALGLQNFGKTFGLSFKYTLNLLNVPKVPPKYFYIGLIIWLKLWN